MRRFLRNLPAVSLARFAGGGDAAGGAGTKGGRPTAVPPASKKRAKAPSAAKEKKKKGSPRKGAASGGGGSWVGSAEERQLRELAAMAAMQMMHRLAAAMAESRSQRGRDGGERRNSKRSKAANAGATKRFPAAPVAAQLTADDVAKLVAAEKAGSWSRSVRTRALELPPELEGSAAEASAPLSPAATSARSHIETAVESLVVAGLYNRASDVGERLAEGLACSGAGAARDATLTITHVAPDDGNVAVVQHVPTRARGAAEQGVGEAVLASIQARDARASPQQRRSGVTLAFPLIPTNASSVAEATGAAAMDDSGDDGDDDAPESARDAIARAMAEHALLTEFAHIAVVHPRRRCIASSVPRGFAPPGQSNCRAKVFWRGAKARASTFEECRARAEAAALDALGTEAPRNATAVLTVVNEANGRVSVVITDAQHLRT